VSIDFPISGDGQWRTYSIPFHEKLNGYLTQVCLFSLCNFILFGVSPAVLLLYNFIGITKTKHTKVTSVPLCESTLREGVKSGECV
jgi:hypothetical protein